MCGRLVESGDQERCACWCGDGDACVPAAGLGGAGDDRDGVGAGNAR